MQAPAARASQRWGLRAPLKEQHFSFAKRAYALHDEPRAPTRDTGPISSQNSTETR